MLESSCLNLDAHARQPPRAATAASLPPATPRQTRVCGCAKHQKQNDGGVVFPHTGNIRRIGHERPHDCVRKLSQKHGVGRSDARSPGKKITFQSNSASESTRGAEIAEPNRSSVSTLKKQCSSWPFDCFWSRHRPNDDAHTHPHTQAAGGRRCNRVHVALAQQPPLDCPAAASMQGQLVRIRNGTCTAAGTCEQAAKKLGCL